MPKTVRILIADDSDRDYDLMQHALAESGCATDLHRVRDGVEAIDFLMGRGRFADRIAHRFPDLVIADLKMPRMNGFEFLEWLRLNPRFQVIPTIVLSSSAVRHDVERAYASGAHSYFVKPIDFGAFVALFRHVAAYWAHALTPGALREE